MGVKATADIKNGEYLCEYSGELVTKEEAIKREAEYSRKGNGCYMFFFKGGQKELCVDATLPEKCFTPYGRLINHSKYGNVFTRKYEVDGRYRLAMFAARDMIKDEELLSDYGDRNAASVKAFPWLAS